jgi:hypothetical protein
MNERERRPPNDLRDPIDDPGPGSDSGAAYERALEEGQVERPQDDGEERGPDVGDVFRSGS